MAPISSSLALSNSLERARHVAVGFQRATARFGFDTGELARACPRERPIVRGASPRRVLTSLALGTLEPPALLRRALPLRVASCRAAAHASLSRARSVLSPSRFHAGTTAQPRAIENQSLVFANFSTPRNALAVRQKKKRCDWLKTPSEVNLADWRSSRRRHVAKWKENTRFRPASLPRALRLERTSRDELREHGGSHELRRGFARGRGRERAPAQARCLD